jgi:glycosyltransferase involved in cell wall biosynthesis
MMAFFSVVIPVYNRADFVGKTIDSVLHQELRDREIIIVDDGSTDNTINILKKYGKQIKILQQKNKGPGAARNLGIEFSTGDYITFLDSDDLWFPWTLTTYKKAIIEHNYPDFVAGNELNFVYENELTSVDKYQVKFQYYSDYYASAYQNLWIGTRATAIRKDALDEVGGYCSQNINAEDSDLWLRLGVAKGFVYIQSPRVSAYRRHPDSEVANSFKSYQGKLHLIRQEKTQKYPGQKERERERLHIITRHVRSHSLACLRQKDISKGWQLYRATFFWHLKLMRLRYLLGFLLIATRAISGSIFTRARECFIEKEDYRK